MKTKVINKIIIGGLAFMATLLLNAEDTKITSYTQTIDDQVNKSTETNPTVKAPESDKNLQKQANDRNVEQNKWNKLSDSDKRKITEKRTEKRNEAIEHINKRLGELDDESAKLSDKKSDMLDKEQFDRKQREIDQKKGKLTELKTKLENAPEGQNVDLEVAAMDNFQHTTRR